MAIALAAIAALACLMVVLLAGGEAASVNAQASPLSPLAGGGPTIALAPWPVVNVMANGQAALMRLALLLFAVIVGAGVIMWRQP